MQEAHLESLKVAHHSPCLSGACWGFSGSPRETTSVKHYWLRGATRWQRAGLAHSRPCVRSTLSTGVGECLTYLYRFCINIYSHNSRNLRGSFHRRTQWASGAEVYCESRRQTGSAVGSRFHSPSHPHILFSQPMRISIFLNRRVQESLNVLFRRQKPKRAQASFSP